MPSKLEFILVAAALCLAAAFIVASIQAGYMNAFADGEPVLWKSRYDSVRALAEDLDYKLNESMERVSELEDDLNGSRQEHNSCVQNASLLAGEVANLSGALDDAIAERDELDLLRFRAEAELEAIRSNVSDLWTRVRMLESQNSELGRLLASTLNRTAEFEEAVQMEGEIHRSYEWSYVTERTWSKGTSSQRGSGFNRTEYLLLATSAHIEDTDEESYADVIRLPSDDLKELADFLYGLGATDLQRVNNILKFVQNLHYIHDYDSHNYVRYPLETLVEGGGDCEDTSMLAAALMRLAGEEGFPVIVLTVDTDSDQEVDHMMIGVSFEGGTGTSYEHGGRDYYVCETTSRWYSAGQLPAGYRIEAAIQID